MKESRQQGLQQDINLTAVRVSVQVKGIITKFTNNHFQHEHFTAQN